MRTIVHITDLVHILLIVLLWLVPVAFYEVRRRWKSLPLSLGAAAVVALLALLFYVKVIPQ